MRGSQIPDTAVEYHIPQMYLNMMSEVTWANISGPKIGLRLVVGGGGVFTLAVRAWAVRVSADRRL